MGRRYAHDRVEEKVKCQLGDDFVNLRNMLQKHIDTMARRIKARNVVNLVGQTLTSFMVSTYKGQG